MQLAENPGLVERARTGDEGALVKLMRLYEPRLVRMIELRLDASLRPALEPFHGIRPEEQP